MATYYSYTPASLIARAMFNLDATGTANFKLSGLVNVSVSDSFTYQNYLNAYPSLSPDIYTSLSSGAANWTSTQLANINLTTSAYSQFINLIFSTVANYSGSTPADVGRLSDINISLIYRTDWSYAGESAISTDASFGYAYSRGDIVLNINGFGGNGLFNDYSLDSTSYGFHILMHEFGHSLGLSHPHSSYTNGSSVITADYAATTTLGFDKLGFVIASAADMNKEYFSIMSYDAQRPLSGSDTYAQTPMILDVIALQTAYGEGGGTSGSSNDVITAGGGGGITSYRTYFDAGGVDTANLANYAAGAYFNMGTTIVGASHLVGVSMSTADAATMRAGGSPSSLRWFYGEFENAIGSAGDDWIVDNALNNLIRGGGGNDTFVCKNGGNDILLGESGSDTLIFSAARSQYTLAVAASGWCVVAGPNGFEAINGVESLQFADQTLSTNTLSTPVVLGGISVVAASSLDMSNATTWL